MIVIAGIIAIGIMCTAGINEANIIATLLLGNDPHVDFGSSRLSSKEQLAIVLFSAWSWGEL